jgi:hypothetical protein
LFSSNGGGSQLSQEVAIMLIYAFVDYESVGRLSKLDLSRYARIVLFVGACQHKIDCNVHYPHALQLTVVKIEKRQRNNLDFHLAYYLGLLDHATPSAVGFEVISNDKGFTPLVHYLQARGRVCAQIEMESERQITPNGEPIT